ncbi:MAG: UbiX family flavin prenyltransferase [Deltaproteobacteria bacterium]|nr:MAG: UbiX family flavin prenyltransferase [Deltaproteobacteria bacterium]
MRIFVALTGASGAVYGVRVVEKLVSLGQEVTVCASATALGILRDEGCSGDGAGDYEEFLRGCFRCGGEVEIARPDDFSSPFASGSNPPDAMAVVPCSMGTLGRIAAGISTTLIERAADVCLKERKTLVLVPRESPLNLVHVRNMETLIQAGATIMPAAPSFYHRPRTVDELVDFFAGRVVESLGVKGGVTQRWGEKKEVLE